MEKIPADINYHGAVVAFDLDDTLFHERDYCHSGFKLIEGLLSRKYQPIFAALSLRLNSYLKARKNYFSLLEDILRFYSGKLGIREDEISGLVKESVTSYRNHIPADLRLAEDVKDVLDELSERGCVMAIITDGRSITQRCKIKSLGLERYIPEKNIIISEETGADKKSPDNFSRLVNQYPEAKKFIYIGDNERKDFLMPNLLGWETYKVPYDIDKVHPNYESADKMEAPKKILSSFSDILKYL